MQKIILSDTSCLIILEKIGELELLHTVFGEIVVTGEVAAEYGLPLTVWVSIQNPHDKIYQQILEASVDKGEASAIALAVELDDCLLIIDDLKGRNLAEQHRYKNHRNFRVNHRSQTFRSYRIGQAVVEENQTNGLSTVERY